MTSRQKKEYNNDVVLLFSWLKSACDEQYLVTRLLCSVLVMYKHAFSIKRLRSIGKQILQDKMQILC